MIFTIILMQTSTGVCFSWNEINPCHGILNLQPPNFTTLLTIMNDERYLTEVVWCHGNITHLQDTAFSTLLQFMNNLEQHTIEDKPYDELVMFPKRMLVKTMVHMHVPLMRPWLCTFLCLIMNDRVDLGYFYVYTIYENYAFYSDGWVCFVADLPVLWGW